MLRQTTIDAAYSLAELLNNKGLEVTPIGETPLAVLNQSTVTTVPKQFEAEQSGEDFFQLLLDGSRMKDAGGNLRHDQQMDEIVNVVSETVKRNLYVAKTVVNPIVKEVVADTEKLLADAMITKTTYLQVVFDALPELYATTVLEDMVGRFKETPYADVNLKLGWEQDVSRQAMFELAKTGAPSFDEQLKELCSSISDEEIEVMFNSVFGELNNGRSRLLTDVIGIKQPVNTLMIHLFSRNLMETIPDGLNIGLSEYKNYMADILSQSGKTILAIISNRQRDIRTNVLVKSMPSADRLGYELITIKVIGENYTRFLEEGGTPETLFGALVTDGERGYKSLLSKKDKYENEWKKTERVLITQSRMEKFNEAVKSIELAVTKQINEIDEEIVPVPKELLHAKLKESVAGLYGKFYDDLNVYARKIVCEVMFAHTDAFNILCAIDSVCEDFPEIDIREAALLATIEIVSDWVAKLCTVKRIGG